jgi:hypothetical protein
MPHIKNSNAQAGQKNWWKKYTVLQLELECIMQSWAKDAMNQPNDQLA